MKASVLIYACFLIAGAFSANSQISNFEISGNVSSAGCTDYDLYIRFDVGEIAEEQPNIQIHWGDGFVENWNDNAVFYANSENEINDFKQYVVPGNRTIYVTFTSSVTQQTLISNQLNITYLEQVSCGTIMPYVGQILNCGSANPSIGNPLFDLIDGNGVQSTFEQNIWGLDMTAVPYTISYNDAWLESHGFIQASEDLIVSGFDEYYNPVNYSDLYLDLESVSISSIPDYKLENAYGNAIAPLEEGEINFFVSNLFCGDLTNRLLLVTFPDDIIPITTELINPIIQGNTLSFEDNMNSFFKVKFTMPGTIPAGTLLPFHCEVQDLSNAENALLDNALDFNIEVLNSYDPNEKNVNLPYYLDALEDESLIYTIHFQNEGNFSAVNVKISDTLSENLDLRTFKVLESSHALSTSLDSINRLVTFRFKDCYLSPKVDNELNSTGYVTYLIQEKENLPVNSFIKNTAYIYFDFNPAIITNTTENLNSILEITSHLKSEMEIYPNPANDKINIKLPVGMSHYTLEILDINGKVLLNSSLKNELNSVDISEFKNGLYFLKLSTKDFSETVKFIKN